MRSFLFNYLVVSHLNCLGVLWYYDYQMPWKWDNEVPTVITMLK